MKKRPESQVENNANPPIISVHANAKELILKLKIENRKEKCVVETCSAGQIYWNSQAQTETRE
jgi:hypothetical protein